MYGVRVIERCAQLCGRNIICLFDIIDITTDAVAKSFYHSGWSGITSAEFYYNVTTIGVFYVDLDLEASG